MRRVYIGLTWTKVQIATGIPTSVYIGPSLAAAKIAVQTPVTAGTASIGGLISNVDPHMLTKGRNPAGT